MQTVCCIRKSFQWKDETPRIRMIVRFLFELSQCFHIRKYKLKILWKLIVAYFWTLLSWSKTERITGGWTRILSFSNSLYVRRKSRGDKNPEKIWVFSFLRSESFVTFGRNIVAIDVCCRLTEFNFIYTNIIHALQHLVLWSNLV